MATLVTPSPERDACSWLNWPHGEPHSIRDLYDLDAAHSPHRKDTMMLTSSDQRFVAKVTELKAALADRNGDQAAAIVLQMRSIDQVKTDALIDALILIGLERMHTRRR
jgi:hypothetical protein